MSTDMQTEPVRTPTWMSVFGWIISLLPGLGILALEIGKLTGTMPMPADAPAGPSGCMYAIGVLVLTLLIVVGLIAGVSQALPTDYRLARSETINAPPSAVFPHVVDFNKWSEWIPFVTPEQVKSGEVVIT